MGQPVLGPDQSSTPWTARTREGDEAAPLDPALQHDHAVVDVDEEPVGIIVNSPTIRSSMILRRMDRSGRLNTFSRSARLTIPTS
jgi:hypothetical protein